MTAKRSKAVEPVVSEEAIEVVEPVDEVQAAEYRNRVEADFDPAETARQRLERLEAETADMLKVARAAAKLEAKGESENILREWIDPLLATIQETLNVIEDASNKTFRSFSFYYKMPKSAVEPEIKLKYALVRARGESTADDADESAAADGKVVEIAQEDAANNVASGDS